MEIMFLAALWLAGIIGAALALLVIAAPALVPWVYDRLALPPAERAGMIWNGWRLGLLLLLLNQRWTILTWYSSILILLTLALLYANP
jgi:hypothetical protein